MCKPVLAGLVPPHAIARFEQAVDKAMPLFKKHGIARPAIRVQHMRKRWGSCTPKGTIMLNPDLIRAPGPCIDYVVIHELCHLVHPDHGRAFLNCWTAQCRNGRRGRNGWSEIEP